MTPEPFLHPIEMALRASPWGTFVRHSFWAWPVLESLHFMGMSVLIGTVGLFDLRLMGFARGVPFAAMHRLIPLGIAAFTMNALTGFLFLSAMPDQYLYNLAFRVKVSCILIAGFNILFFYGRVFRRLSALTPDSPPPISARVVGALSLAMWICVMSAGRLLTFFRPAFITF